MNMPTVKMVLTLATLWGVPAQYANVPKAFAQLDKENDLDFFLHVLGGMELTSLELSELGIESAAESVLRLKKTLLGLKQTGRLWGKLIHDKLTEP